MWSRFSPSSRGQRLSRTPQLGSDLEDRVINSELITRDALKIEETDPNLGSWSCSAFRWCSRFFVGGLPILPLPPVTSSSRSNHIFTPICRGRRSSSLANSSSPPYPLRHLHSHSLVALTQGRPIQRENSSSGRWNRPLVRFGRVIRVFRIFLQSAFSHFHAIRVIRVFPQFASIVFALSAFRVFRRSRLQPHRE